MWQFTRERSERQSSITFGLEAKSITIQWWACIRYLEVKLTKYPIFLPRTRKSFKLARHARVFTVYETLAIGEFLYEVSIIISRAARRSGQRSLTWAREACTMHIAIAITRTGSYTSSSVSTHPFTPPPPPPPLYFWFPNSPSLDVN